MATSTINPAFTSGGTDVAPIKPGQNLGSATTLGVNTVGSNVGTTSTPSTTPQVNTTQPSPTNTNTTPNGAQPLTPDELNALAKQTGYTPTGGGFASTGLSAKYNSALSQTSGSAPQDMGDANDKLKDILPPDVPKNPLLQTLQNDPGYQKLQEDYKSYTDALTKQQSLTDLYSQMEKDSGLPALKTEAMNLKNIIDGTENDIRNEITKAGGFATESQVLALSNARNKQNILDYNKLQDNISNVENHINTMVGLSKEDKANLLQEYKTQIDYDKTISDYADKFTANAKEGYNKIISTPGYGYKALYDSTGGDPKAVAMVESTLGLGQGTLAQLAKENNTQWGSPYQLGNNIVQQNSQTGEIRNISSLSSDPSSSANQQKLEQQYRQILVKEVSNRAGTIGTEDAKVAQANHLASMFNQYYDSTTGNYNIPLAQYGELVIGLASLISKTGTPTNEQIQNIYQKTAKGDIAGAISYVTGTTPTGTTQQVLKNLKDSIDRQAQTAVSNREAGIQYLRGLAPTDLDPLRAQSLEKNTLVSYNGIGTGTPEEKAKVESLLNTFFSKNGGNYDSLKQQMNSAQAQHPGTQPAIDTASGQPVFATPAEIKSGKFIAI